MSEACYVFRMFIHGSVLQVFLIHTHARHTPFLTTKIPKFNQTIKHRLFLVYTVNLFFICYHIRLLPSVKQEHQRL